MQECVNSRPVALYNYIPLNWEDLASRRTHPPPPPKFTFPIIPSEQELTYQQQEQQQNMFMTLLYYFFGISAGLIALIFVVGHFMPAQVKVTTAKAVIPGVSIDTLWDLAHNPEKVSSTDETSGIKIINDDISKMEWSEDLSGNTSLVFKTVASSPPGSKNAPKSASYTRHVKDTVVPLSMTLDGVMKETSEGVEFHLTEDMKIDNGTWHVPIFRVIMYFNAGYGSRSYVKRLTAAATGKEE